MIDRLFVTATRVVRALILPENLRLAQLTLMAFTILSLGLYFLWRFGPESPDFYGSDWDRSGFGEVAR